MNINSFTQVKMDNFVKLDGLVKMDNFVKLDGQKFKLNNRTFYPQGVNYVVSVLRTNNNQYYVVPNANYVGNYTGANEAEVYMNKLREDMSKMHSRGINTLRIFFQNPDWVQFNDTEIVYPQGITEDEYFTIISNFLDILKEYDLKAILVCISPNNHTSYSFKKDLMYCKFLKRIATYLKNKTSLMAYDFMNEPTSFNGGLSKYINSSIISKWHYIIKQASPNHLTTIGYSYEPSAVSDWDFTLDPVDFASFHIYTYTEDLQYSRDKLGMELKWYGNNTYKPWIVGETGYSGTDKTIDDFNNLIGTELQQKEYADFSMQRALDCNCGGYLWWQFQEVMWDSVYHNHFGIITGYLEGSKEKKIVQSFINFNNQGQQSSNCIKDENYYRLRCNGNILKHIGKIIDDNGNPIEDAIINGSAPISGSDNAYNNSSTFSYPNGNFFLYANFNPNLIYVSAPGYSTLKLNPSSLNIGNIILNKSNYINCWMKKYSNNNSDEIAGWGITDNNRFYPGDFDGDGIDELLCVKEVNNGWITMLDYYEDTWHWTWSTYGSQTTGSNIYNYKENLLIGDFDGDGKDEIFGLNSSSMKMFKYEDGNFVQKWFQPYSSNMPSSIWNYRDKIIIGDFDGDNIDEILCRYGVFNMIKYNGVNWISIWTNNGINNGMQPYNHFLAGDFDGDGKDELLGNDIEGGGWITMFRYVDGSFNWVWSDNGNDNVGIYPFRNKLIVGNFDSDNADEILGIDSWATKFDFYDNKFNWTWSTEHSKILGDWPVNKYNTCFAMKADNIEPEYLVVINNNIGTSTNFCNMYLKSPLEGADRPSYVVYSNQVVEAEVSNVINKNKNTNEMINNTNTNEMINEKIPIYPNPANNEINVILPIDKKYRIDLVNMQNTLIKSFQNMSGNIVIDCSNINAGIYIINIYHAEQTFHYKIVIVK
jgi:hypothetical protein